MNEKIYIQRKYNKCINILLAIYVILCLVLSLLFNGFFIKTKAYNGSFTEQIEMSCSGYAGANDTPIGGSTTLNITGSNNNSKGVFYFGEDLKEFMNTSVFSDNFSVHDAFCYVYYNSTYSYTSPVDNLTNNGAESSTFLNNNNITGFTATLLYLDKSFNLNNPSQKLVTTTSLETDVDYVDNLTDLQKFLNGDYTVVNHGNPSKPTTTQDGNLPTPQKVNLWDSAQNCAGLTWDNPKSINKYIKELGDNVGIEIEWKPSIALTFGMLTVDSLTSSEWLPVYKGVISKSGSLINAFVSKKNNNARLDNNLNGYNYEIDDKYIFTPTTNDNDYLEQIAKNNHVRLWYANEDNVTGGSLNESDVRSFKKNTLDDSNELMTNKNVVGGEAETPVGEEGVNVAPSGISKLDLIQGIITGVGKVGKWIFDSFQIDTSNYRVRYYVKDGNDYTVSNWVDAKRGYDTNENAKEPTNVNFTDSNNNPVSNPTYLPSNQVTSSDSNSNSWWDRFYTENNNVLANLQIAFANFTADSGDFFGFFRALFTEFPEFYIFLCMGLGLAIMLRILGR